MNINEVAKLTELSPGQIREYEKLGLLQTIQRTDSGYRVFSDTQLQRLKFIKHARDVGFSLAQIERYWLYKITSSVAMPKSKH